MRSKKSEIDTSALAEACERKRKALRLRKFQAARAAGVSTSVYSRLTGMDCARPSLESFLRLCQWLDVPPHIFMPSHVGLKHEMSTLDKIEAALQNDPTLTPDVATSISEMMRNAYGTFVMPSDKNDITQRKGAARERRVA